MNPLQENFEMMFLHPNNRLRDLVQWLGKGWRVDSKLLYNSKPVALSLPNAGENQNFWGY